MIHTIVIILIVLFLLGCLGGYAPATRRYYGTGGFIAPGLGTIAVILLICWLLGLL